MRLYVTMAAFWSVIYRFGIQVLASNSEVARPVVSLLVSILLCLLLAACAAAPEKKPFLPPAPAKLSTDLATLESLRRQLADLDDQFSQFRQQGDWKTRGYFDAGETRELEQLLFLFTAYHTALWDMVQSYGGVEIQAATSPEELKVHILSATALLLLVNHTAHLVTEFAGDDIAIEKTQRGLFSLRNTLWNLRQGTGGCHQPRLPRSGTQGSRFI